MRRKFWIWFLIGSICIAAASAVGILTFYKKSIDLELTLLDKSYKPGQKVHLSAVVMTRSFNPLQALINARIKSKDVDAVLQTYFPTLQRNKEYKFDFDYVIPRNIPSGKYRLIVRIMSYGDSDTIEDIASVERSFRINPPRKLSAKEIATRKAVKRGKGIPLDADLVLYPIEEMYVSYGKTLPLIGMFKNITYWDGDYKLAVTVIDPAEAQKEFSKSYRIASNKQQEFSFEYDISNEKPEGRYAVIVRLLNDREGKKGYGNLISEVVSSFSLKDVKPSVRLDNIELSVPGKSEYEFEIRASDDRGIVNVLFNYDVVEKSMIKNVARMARLKKKKQKKTAVMELVSGDEREGVWMCTILMPSEKSKFVFSIEVKDTLGQVVTTEQYPILVTKAVKKKKDDAEQSTEEFKSLPGFQGYNDWNY